MENLKELMLSRATSWGERMKIKWNGAPATYLCRELKDFLQHREQMRIGETLLLPKLTYFTSDTREDGSGIPVNLNDDTAETEAIARYLCINHQEGRFMQDCVPELMGGQTLYLPILTNGFQLPGVLTMPRYEDARIFLVSYATFKNPKTTTQKKRISGSLLNLFPGLVPEPALAPVRV
ncbi:MAG: hypothetical protein AABX07_03335 [Nanoarchaeota archaeon]